MPNCESAAVCGQLDKHPAEKKELQELGKRKQKAEVELKALRSELSVKETVSKDLSKSFEARIHDVLIRTNLGKYLTANNKPKEGIILADSYILKKYYSNKMPDDLESESEIWQTIIKSHEDNFQAKLPKNSVIKELENRGVNWPTSPESQTSSESLPAVNQANADFQPVQANYNQLNWFTPPYYAHGFGGYFPVPGCTSGGFMSRAVSSPPPPPPDDVENEDNNA
ncbi:MAG: hypothetical protein N0E59_23025 [Candidatus Thiodiazotropha taylori]|nr:hypothetical protein [Candidatus Thiodiazotropha taylori]MCG8113635.1 hypothetical protein [Candidatus Thiodiazotropha taylori]MCW4285995.1 hypothetical protein [Candidatus Thiodiazotropha taylori]MCW4344687.1 hypothetical protein [Candidatus Thiodiazotropha endolucinida]